MFKQTTAVTRMNLESLGSRAASDTEPRLWIPSEALRSDDGTPVVFVARGETVERRTVATGLEDGGAVEVLAGLSAGERVVVEGPPALADGDRVDVR